MIFKPRLLIVGEGHLIMLKSFDFSFGLSVMVKDLMLKLKIP